MCQFLTLLFILNVSFSLISLSIHVYSFFLFILSWFYFLLPTVLLFPPASLSFSTFCLSVISSLFMCFSRILISCSYFVALFFPTFYLITFCTWNSSVSTVTGLAVCTPSSVFNFYSR